MAIGRILNISTFENYPSLRTFSPFSSLLNLLSKTKLLSTTISSNIHFRKRSTLAVHNHVQFSPPPNTKTRLLLNPRPASVWTAAIHFSLLCDTFKVPSSIPVSRTVSQPATSSPITYQDVTNLITGSLKTFPIIFSSSKYEPILNLFPSHTSEILSPI